MPIRLRMYPAYVKLKSLGVDLLLDHLEVKDALNLLLELLVLWEQDGVEHRFDLSEQLQGLRVDWGLGRQLLAQDVPEGPLH